MRLCTTTLERAFPELDGLAVEECSRLIRRARKFGGSRPAFCTSVGLLVGTAWVVLVFTLGPGLAERVGPVPEWLGRLAAVAVGPYMGMVLGAVAGLACRDRVLRRAILEPILRCLRCGYRLRGLEPERDAVTCPECGHTHDLCACGLVEDDLSPAA